MKNYISTFNL